MHLATKVLVRDITNLTDARYFAAWGVDIVAYTGDPHADTFLPPQKMKEIIEWLEGPKHMIMFPGLIIDEEVLEKVKLLNIDYLGISKFIDVPPASSYDIFSEIEIGDDIPTSTKGLIIKTMNIREENLSKITVLSQNYEVYIEGIKSAQDVAYIVDSFDNVGIVLKGGDEERTGVKTFEELDEIYEMLIN